LRERSHWSTRYLMEQFAAEVHPKRLVEKSPSVVYQTKSLRRLLLLFPHARFIHLLRHPRGQCTSVMKRISIVQGRGIRVARWLIDLASFPVDHGGGSTVAQLDPQGGWYQLNFNIYEFLESIPKEQQLRVRGESLLGDPDRVLRDICEWMEIRGDPEAIEQMKHPEISPFARIGPKGAEFGNDPAFLQSPCLCMDRVEPQTLEGSLMWRSDGLGFSPKVKELARRFGYE
jgi:hypothetical protein